MIIAVCLAIGMLGAAMIWQTGQLSMIPMPIIGIGIAVIFHSLTVEVSDTELRWHFGPGFWTHRLALDENRYCFDRA